MKIVVYDVSFSQWISQVNALMLTFAVWLKLLFPSYLIQNNVDNTFLDDNLDTQQLPQ
jgi:low affinity Fe/Cu permease